MSAMVGWVIRKPNYEHVETVYYADGCDEGYIRRAEEIPQHYTLEREA